jgi:hypothetical protein
VRSLRRRWRPESDQQPVAASFALPRPCDPLLDQAATEIGVDLPALLGAVVAMRVEDYFANGKRWWVRLHEKGGKRHEMPAHHKLEAFLDEYLRAAGIAGDERSPLFRSAVRRTGALAVTAMHRVDAWRMIQRRAGDLGLKAVNCREN